MSSNVAANSGDILTNWKFFNVKLQVVVTSTPRVFTKLFNSSFLFSSTRACRCFFLLSSNFFLNLLEPSVMKNEINLKISIVLFLYKQEPTYMLDMVGF